MDACQSQVGMAVGSEVGMPQQNCTEVQSFRPREHTEGKDDDIGFLYPDVSRMVPQKH
jgi:hypothetical protein